MARPLLTTRWSKLLVVSFAVRPESLEHYLPLGTELDYFDGRPWLSLVCLESSRSRFRGLPPFRTYPGINFRFYVRRGERRGVVFLREIVPSTIVAWTARKFFNQHFRSAPVTVHADTGEDGRRIEYQLDLLGSRYRIGAVGDAEVDVPAEDSLEHFLIEKYWGFTRNRGGQTLSFRVEHPAWRTSKVRQYFGDWDWGSIYGPKWDFLQERTPDSVILADGSDARIFPATPL